MVRTTFQDIATRSAEDALRLLSSSRDGLTTDQAAQRLAEYGVNELTVTQTTAIDIFLRQFRSSFIYLLFAASAIKARKSCNDVFDAAQPQPHGIFTERRFRCATVPRVM